MRELEINLRSGSTELTINTEAMKLLHNNFSIIKELELINVKKIKDVEFLNTEIKRLELGNAELFESNQKFYAELQKYKEDNNNVLNSYLKNNKNNNNSKTQTGFKKNNSDDDLEDFDKVIHY